MSSLSAPSLPNERLFHSPALCSPESCLKSIFGSFAWHNSGFLSLAAHWLEQPLSWTATKRVNHQLRLSGEASLPGWGVPRSSSYRAHAARRRRWALDTWCGCGLYSVSSISPRHSAPARNRPAQQAPRGRGPSRRRLRARPLRRPRPHEASAPQLHRQGVRGPPAAPAPPRAQMPQALPPAHPRSRLRTRPCFHLSEPASLSSSPCSSYLDSCSEILLITFIFPLKMTILGDIYICSYIFPLFTHRETETGGQVTCLKSSSVISIRSKSSIGIGPTGPARLGTRGPQPPGSPPPRPTLCLRPAAVIAATDNASGLRWGFPCFFPGCTSHLNILILMPERISLLTFLFIRLGSLDALND